MLSNKVYNNRVGKIDVKLSIQSFLLDGSIYFAMMPSIEITSKYSSDLITSMTNNLYIKEGKSRCKDAHQAAGFCIDTLLAHSSSEKISGKLSCIGVFFSDPFEEFPKDRSKIKSQENQHSLCISENTRRTQLIERERSIVDQELVNYKKLYLEAKQGYISLREKYKKLKEGRNSSSHQFPEGYTKRANRLLNRLQQQGK